MGLVDLWAGVPDPPEVSSAGYTRGGTPFTGYATREIRSPEQTREQTEGLDARFAGLTVGENPYGLRTVAGRRWLHGWTDADVTIRGWDPGAKAENADRLISEARAAGTLTDDQRVISGRSTAAYTVSTIGTWKIGTFQLRGVRGGFRYGPITSPRVQALTPTGALPIGINATNDFTLFFEKFTGAHGTAAGDDDPRETGQTGETGRTDQTPETVPHPRRPTTL